MSPKEEKITHSLCVNTEYFIYLPWAVALMGHCFVHLILIAVPLPANNPCVGSCEKCNIHAHVFKSVNSNSIHHKCKHNPGHLGHRDYRAAAPGGRSRPYPASVTPTCLLPLLVSCLVLGSWCWHRECSLCHWWQWRLKITDTCHLVESLLKTTC